MRPARRVALMSVCAATLAVACAKVPYTGRTQYNLVPDSLMRGLSKTTYTSMLAESTVEKKGNDVDLLNKVGSRISRVADQPKYDWNFTMLDEEQVNAWALPGGYISFYSGILPVLKHEAGMAFVMGHEVGHATAHHGAERVTQQLTVLGGIVGLELYLKDHSKLDQTQRGILMGALGLGATVGVVLPFSRMHESEADVLGVMYMSKAGYPPQESLGLWDRMEALSGGSGLPAFMSTHPTNKKRKANLKEWLPQANKRYQRNKLAHDTTTTLWTAKDGPKGGGNGPKHPGHVD